MHIPGEGVVVDIEVAEDDFEAVMSNVLSKQPLQRQSLRFNPYHIVP